MPKGNSGSTKNFLSPATVIKFINVTGIIGFIAGLRFLQMPFMRAEVTNAVVNNDASFNLSHAVPMYVKDQLNNTLLDVYIENTQFRVREEEKLNDPSVDADEVADAILKIKNNARRAQLRKQFTAADASRSRELILEQFDFGTVDTFRQDMTNSLQQDFDATKVINYLNGRRNLLQNKLNAAAFHSPEINKDNIDPLFNKITTLIKSDSPNQGFWFAAALGFNTPGLSFMHHHQRQLNIATKNNLDYGKNSQDAISLLCAVGNLIPEQSQAALNAAEFLLTHTVYNQSIFYDKASYIFTHHPCIRLAAFNLEPLHLHLIQETGYLWNVLRDETLYYALGGKNAELSLPALNFRAKYLCNEVMPKTLGFNFFKVFGGFQYTYAKFIIEGKKRSADFMTHYARKALQTQSQQDQEAYLREIPESNVFLKEKYGNNNLEINNVIRFNEILLGMQDKNYNIQLILTGLAVLVSALFYFRKSLTPFASNRFRAFTSINTRQPENQEFEAKHVEEFKTRILAILNDSFDSLGTVRVLKAAITSGNRENLAHRLRQLYTQASNKEPHIPMSSDAFDAMTERCQGVLLKKLKPSEAGRISASFEEGLNELIASVTPLPPIRLQ